MPSTFAFAGIEHADPQQIQSLLDARFPEDFEGEALFYLPKPSGNGCYAALRGHLTGMFGKSGVRSVASPLTSLVKAGGVPLALPTGEVMEIAREARKRGVQVCDFRTGRDLVLAGEVAPLPEVSPDLGSLSYGQLVELGRNLTSGYQWRLALLSQAVETGGGALQQYAEDIAVNYASLRTVRSVYQAWQHFPGFAGLTFGVAKALMAHPDREKLVATHPDMTVAQAEQFRAKAEIKPKPVESRPAEDPSDDAEVVEGEAVDGPEGDGYQDSANSADDDPAPVRDPASESTDGPVLDGVVIPPAPRDSAADADLRTDEDDERLSQRLDLAERIEAIDAALNSKIQAGLDDDKMAEALAALERALEAIQAL